MSGVSFHAPTQGHNVVAGVTISGGTFNANFNGMLESYTLNGCLRSLAFPEMKNRLNDIDDAVEGTCLWLPRHEVYGNWVRQHRGLFCIKGKPGSGKSTLLKHALRLIEAGPGTLGDDVILSFFFHGRGTELQKSPLGLFGSLLHQLLVREPDTLSEVVDFFIDQCERVGPVGKTWKWHPRQLQRHIESSLAKILDKRPVWIFIDALDECGEENAVELIDYLRLLAKKLPHTTFQLRLCLSCRHYPVLINDELEVCPEHENMDDIALFTQTQLHDFPCQDPEYSVGNKILERASGVFMRAHIVVKRVLTLQRKGKGLRQIQEGIQRTPSDLYALYHELVQGMESRAISRRLVDWVCFSAEPLTVEQLLWAAAIDPDHSYKSLEQCQQSDKYMWNDAMMERRLKTLSCGLAETVPSYISTLDSRTVQFIHQSVKDFFIEKGLSVLAASGDSPMPSVLVAGHAHYNLARTCVCYLATGEIIKWMDCGQETWESKPPLLSYATHQWIFHLREGETRGVCQDDFIRPWIDVYQSIAEYLPCCNLEETNLFWAISRYGMIDPLYVILQKLEEFGTSIDAKDGPAISPETKSACYRKAIELLLHTGRISWVNIGEAISVLTPLAQAAHTGCQVSVKLLIGCGKVDVNERTKYGRTPLWFAVEGGHEPIVKLLLDTGKVNLKAEDAKYSPTILWVALEQRNERVIKMLLETDKVDLGTRNEWGMEPLSWASRLGYEIAVRLLLNTGKADVDARDISGLTALSWAAQRGHGAIVRLLLDTGQANVEVKDGFGQTPLCWAAAGGHDAVVKLLQHRTLHHHNP